MTATNSTAIDPGQANGDPQVALDDAHNAADAEHTNQTLQFISFTIEDEEYGVDIMAVREIKGWTEITKLPNTPHYMRGVLNLRGVIVPIFDLRCRFGQGETQATNLHVVIIVAVNERIMGILVDAVSDILTVKSTDVLPVPDAERQDKFLSGLVTVDERMVALLQLDELFDLAAIPAESTQSGATA